MSRFIQARAGGFFRGVVAVAEVLGAARACAAAAEAGHRPAKRHLRTLGIGAEAFDGVRFH